VQTPTVGPDSDSQHALPNVASDTVAVLAATQTLSNKTLSGTYQIGGTPTLASDLYSTASDRKVGYDSSYNIQFLSTSVDLNAGGKFLEINSLRIISNVAITPYVDNSYDFGESSKSWVNAWLRGIKSNVADGASAVGVVIDTSNALTTAGAKIVSFKTNATEKASIDKDGTLALANVLATGIVRGNTLETNGGSWAYQGFSGVIGLYEGASLRYGFNSASIDCSTDLRADLGKTTVAWNNLFVKTVKGNVADGASAVGVIVDTVNSLTTAGSLILSERNAGAQKGYLDRIGGRGQVHLIGLSSTPTHTAGSGAGTSPTITITGNDSAGVIEITTGTTPASLADLITVTFNVAYGAVPFVVISPANSFAAQAGSYGVYLDHGSTATTSFLLKVGSAALTAGTAYKWTYHVHQ
jgi:hypothetical protein